MFWMNDSVGSEGEPLVQSHFFPTDIDFPTQISNHLSGRYTLYFPSRWVRTFPLVECPLSTRHWLKLNIFILLFYLLVTLKKTLAPPFYRSVHWGSLSAVTFP